MRFIRKTSITLLILIFIQFSFANEIDKKIEIKFNIILNDIDSIIKSYTEHNEFVYERYQFVIEKIYSNQIRIAYDSTLNYGFQGCAETRILSDTSNVEIVFGDFLIDIYHKCPTLVYSIFFFQLEHAYEFYNKRDNFLNSIDNNIEELYFNIDALLIESMFIHHYIKNKDELSPYENYLLQDLENNMAGASILFYKTDLGLLHRLDALRNEKTLNKALKAFNSIGDELLKGVKFEGSGWNNYIEISMLNTYVYYSPQILHDINFKLGDGTDEFDLNNYSKTKEIIKKVKEFANDNIEYINYREETLKMFNDYYLNRL